MSRSFGARNYSETGSKRPQALFCQRLDRLSWDPLRWLVLPAIQTLRFSLLGRRSSKKVACPKHLLKFSLEALDLSLVGSSTSSRGPMRPGPPTLQTGVARCARLEPVGIHARLPSTNLEHATGMSVLGCSSLESSPPLRRSTLSGRETLLQELCASGPSAVHR